MNLYGYLFDLDRYLDIFSIWYLVGDLASQIWYLARYHIKKSGLSGWKSGWSNIKCITINPLFSGSLGGLYLAA
jgi:hypothetical protein